MTTFEKLVQILEIEGYLPDEAERKANDVYDAVKLWKKAEIELLKEMSP